jgi:arginine:ornithine antiporter/lysine permease
LLLSALLYAPGVILFAKAKHEQGEPLFTHIEKGIFTCVISGAGLAAYGLYSGLLSF